MPFVVLGVNNDGGRKATLHDTLEDAKQAVRDWLLASDSDPPFGERERSRMEAELSQADGSQVESIRGSDAWKEWLYISPIDPTT